MHNGLTISSHHVFDRPRRIGDKGGTSCLISSQRPVSKMLSFLKGMLRVVGKVFERGRKGILCETFQSPTRIKKCEQENRQGRYLAGCTADIKLEIQQGWGSMLIIVGKALWIPYLSQALYRSTTDTRRGLCVHQIRNYVQLRQSEGGFDHW